MLFFKTALFESITFLSSI